jgi:hypothetical protein
MTAATRCPKCGAKAVRPRKRAGRTMRYRNIAALPIPADFPIPTCGRCAAEYLSPATCDHLAPLLLSSYQAALRRAAAKLVTAATANISQRKTRGRAWRQSRLSVRHQVGEEAAQLGFCGAAVPSGPAGRDCPG